VTDLAGSPEWEQMGEAGARAHHAAYEARAHNLGYETRVESRVEWDDLSDTMKVLMLDAERAALRAALSVVMQEPCPTCHDTGTVFTKVQATDGLGNAHEHIVGTANCPDHRPAATWAVLRPLQDGGMLRPVMWEYDGCVFEDDDEYVQGSMFGVVPPTPEEQE